MLPPASADRHDRAVRELGVARTVACNYRSVHNVYRWYLAIKLRKEKPWRTSHIEIVRDEVENLRRALPCVEADPRLGFHQEAQCYMFSAEAMRRKLRTLERYLRMPQPFFGR